MEAARGLGVGRALIGAVYVAAREEGAARVHWLTHETNMVAMLSNKIADKSGFAQYRKGAGDSGRSRAARRQGLE